MVLENSQKIWFYRKEGENQMVLNETVIFKLYWKKRMSKRKLKFTQF